ncbi:type II toxin-antitoxin system VapC family toxin [Candidatus Bathyarchaeota archaeon]|nr:type II toxin-antitoxin system VapC family toxin [Candidatus Bathyarchaeota archaeon]
MAPLKNVYIDTNVLLAAHMPEDPFYESSRKIYTKLGVDYIGYISPLSLVEIAGVVSKRMQDIRLELVADGIRESFKALSQRERARLIAYKILSKEGLNIFHVPGDVTLDMFMTKVSMPTILSHALSHALQLGLRAFDAYHFATAYDLTQIYRTPLSFFTSNDRHFLELKREIEKALNLIVASSTEFVTLEGL